MCNIECIVYVAKNLREVEIRGRKVIEVGSYGGGGVRPLITSWSPAEYVGVDLREGPGVDVVCNAESLVERFGSNSFDIVISTELLEHVRNWRNVLSDFKNICRPNGVILITTRSKGYPYHGAPYDFWRYELEDINSLFSDFEILNSERDHSEPGVFIKARRPDGFVERDFSDYKLYSIVTNKRMIGIEERDVKTFYFKRIYLTAMFRKRFLRLYYRIFGTNTL